MANDMDAIRISMARAVAKGAVPQDMVEALTNHIATLRVPINKADVCCLGICIEGTIGEPEWQPVLPELTTIPGARFRGFEVFPWGIINNDGFQFKAQFSFDQV
jgi:hypothetical protein